MSGEWGLIKVYKTLAIRWIKSEDIMHNMVTIVDNTVVYNSILLREENLMSSPKWINK